MPGGDSTARHLRRLLGLGFGLAVIVGSTIGVGILRTPGLVASHLHSAPAILVLWIAGGVYTLLGAACLAELGTMLPQAGGYCLHARRAFGERVGFAVGSTDWLTYCSVLAYVSVGLAEFGAVLVPALERWIRPIAVLALVALLLLQWAGVKAGARFQAWTTAVKCVAFLALVVAALTLGPGASPQLAAPAEPSDPSLAGIVIALASVFLAANYAVSCLALVVLRRREPELARPFRAWGYPWSAGIVLVGAAAFVAGVLVGDTASAAKAIGLLALGLVGRALLGAASRDRVAPPAA